MQFSGSSSQRLCCSDRLTQCVLCVQIYCVVCIGLLSDEFSTVNTRLGRPMFLEPLCPLSTPEGLATTNYQLA